MSLSRPRRCPQVVYREIDSSEESESEDEKEDLDEELNKVIYPPLSELQSEFWTLCKSGDKNLLKKFLLNNPDIDLDVRDPQGKDDHGGTFYK